MKHIALAAMLGAAGCSPYVQVQMDLVEQARKGIELASVTQSSHREIAERFHVLQRDRVDEAFDADVRERMNLDADWVIEHRRAYAAALDALATQRQASTEADRVARDNLQATGAALNQLYLLQSLQLRMLSIREFTP